MLSDEQKRVALKKNMEAMSKEAKKLRADGVEGIMPIRLTQTPTTSRVLPLSRV